MTYKIKCYVICQYFQNWRKLCSYCFKSQGTWKINTATVTCLYTNNYVNHVYGVICVGIFFQLWFDLSHVWKNHFLPSLESVYVVSSVAAPSMYENRVYNVTWCDVSVLGLCFLPSVWMTHSSVRLKTNCCRTSLTYRVTCTAFSCAYLSKLRHKCKFQLQSTCMLVISDSQSHVILRSAFGQGQSFTHANSKQQEPCEHRLVSPSRHGYLHSSFLLFYADAWCR